MSRGAIYFDRSGVLKDGVVWDLEVKMEPGIGLLYATSAWEAPSLPGLDIRECPINKEHVTDYQYTGIALDLFASGNLRDFVPVSDMGGFFVSRQFADRLKQTKLTGYKVRDIVTIGCNQSGEENPSILYLEFAGNAGISLRCRVKDAPNSCPHCGKETMVCPRCGQTNWPRCPSCGELTLFRPDAPEYSHPKGLAVESTGGPPIVEGKQWDGSDWFRVKGYLGGHFVSNRAKDWMEKTHTFPIAFKPALLNIEGVEDKFLNK